MRLLDLFESDPVHMQGNERSRNGFDRMAAGAPKHASFCFGRMNPPTIGHAELLRTTVEASRGGEYYIFTSSKQDPQDNPLGYETKIAFLDEMFPEVAQHIVRDASIKTPILAMDWLYQKGIRAMTLVAGKPDLPGFVKMAESWNSKAVRNKYGRDQVILNFVSSGDREDGAKGVEGVSATGARQAALAGDIKRFQETTGTVGALSQKLYDAVRAGMRVKERVSESQVAMRLKDIATVKTGLRDADFYVELRGSEKTVGSVTKEWGPYRAGVKINRTDIVLPQFLYYAMMNLHAQGYFKRLANGVTNLVNIRINDIADIKLGG